MDYRITNQYSGREIELAHIAWVMLMKLVGLDSYRLRPPEVIPPTKSREIADMLSKAMPSLPHTRRGIAATEPLDANTRESRWKDASGYFGGEEGRARVAEFIGLFGEQGELRISRLT